MDQEYQRRLVASQLERLKKRINDESRDIVVEQVNDTVFARIFGRRGAAEPYTVKVMRGMYPVQPWRVGFIDPQIEGDNRLKTPDHDARFWPLSALPGLNGGFHITYQGPYRVFVCMPFTVEYFYYHPDERWEPHVYDLPRVVIQLASKVKEADHFSKWGPLIRLVQ
jgi:hypothetical protein